MQTDRQTDRDGQTSRFLQFCELPTKNPTLTCENRTRHKNAMLGKTQILQF